eukprot:CFRG0714T1
MQAIGLPDFETHWYVVLVPFALAIYFALRVSSNNFTTCPYIITGKPRTSAEKAMEKAEQNAFKAGAVRHFSAEELRHFDGTDENSPVYVAIKGIVYDVSENRDAYKPGKGYALFAGRDASRALALMSLKVDDATANLDGLEPKQMDVLDNWVSFYKKKYKVMGTTGVTYSAHEKNVRDATESAKIK